jgi:hypothetical protein
MTAAPPHRGPSVSPRAQSCLYTLGLLALGALLALGLLAGAAGLALATFRFQAAPASPERQDTSLPLAPPAVVPPAPAATPIPELTPEPTPAPTGRYDVRLHLTEPYLGAIANQSIPRSGIGAGIEAVTIDLQPGNLLILHGRPSGAREFILTFTGQLGVQGDRITVRPLSSSLLLLPVQALIAETVEGVINARLDAYRSAVGFRLLALRTSESELVLDLQLR